MTSSTSSKFIYYVEFGFYALEYNKAWHQNMKLLSISLSILVSKQKLTIYIIKMKKKKKLSK